MKLQVRLYINDSCRLSRKIDLPDARTSHRSKAPPKRKIQREVVWSNAAAVALSNPPSRAFRPIFQRWKRRIGSVFTRLLLHVAVFNDKTLHNCRYYVPAEKHAEAPFSTLVSCLL